MKSVYDDRVVSPGRIAQMQRLQSGAGAAMRKAAVKQDPAAMQQAAARVETKLQRHGELWSACMATFLTPSPSSPTSWR
jgi:hypothetical protein